MFLLTWFLTILGLQGQPRDGIQASPTPGSALTLGMQLVYASQGKESAPWSVDSLDRTVRYAERTMCSVVRFGARDLRRNCVANDTLFAWSDREQALRPSRPVGAGMSMRIPGANGQTIVYETFTADTVTVSDLRIPVIRTAITTMDSTGKVVRRLRERFALSLVTAVEGIFEVPSQSSSEGWTIEREFALVRIMPASDR